MFRVGQEIGNYRVVGLVGRGGQGIVYKAVHTRLGTVHAVKVLAVDVGPLRERLLAEGRIQAHLKNPHVVPVTDVVEVDGALGLVAEYVSGAPLDAWVAAGDPSPETRLAVFRDVCAGVASAHAARVVHRDLKPGNVLVETRDGRPFARVTDFGVAKVLDEALRGGATLPGLAVGTPGYMAPEQLRDAATVDARADVFALGCLLHELMTGARAYPESDLASYAVALDTRQRARIVTLAGLPRTLADRTDALVGACLAYDAAARPADAAAVLAMLDGAPIPAVPPVAPVVVRTPTAVPFERGRADAATLELASRNEAPRNEAPPSAAEDDPFAEPPPRPASRAWIAAVGVLFAGVAAAAGWGITREAPEASALVEAPARPVAEEAAPTAPVVDEPAEAPVPVNVPPVATAIVRAPEAEAAPPRPSRPAAPPEAPRVGRVVATGDGELVELVDGDTHVPPGAAPPGHYTARVRFGADGVVNAAVVSVRAGETVRLRCNAVAARCLEEAP